MLSNRRFAVVGYKIPRDCIIKSNGINGSLNEAWQLLIEETFGINKTAYTKCGSEYMNLSYFTCVRVHKKFRLVTNPVDIQLLTGDTFHGHGNFVTTIILFYESIKVFIEL